MDNTEKKPFDTPTLTVYGSVEQLTQSGGGATTDVPKGTPVSDISAITT